MEFRVLAETYVQEVVESFVGSHPVKILVQEIENRCSLDQLQINVLCDHEVVELFVLELIIPRLSQFEQSFFPFASLFLVNGLDHVLDQIYDLFGF